MKNPLVLSCAALAISAIALVGVIVNSDAPLGKVSDAVAPDPGDTDLLLQRIAELADESRELRNRIAMLESRPAVTQRVPVAVASVSPEQLDAFKEEVQAELETLSTSSTNNQAIEEKIAVYLDKVRVEEKVEKAIGYQAKREANLEHNVEKLTTWLDLTPNQSDSMRSTLLLRQEREAEVLRLWGEGADDQVLGEMKASNGQAFQDELSGFLSTDQLDTYMGQIAATGK